ncbi:MAG: hypothetical protein AAFR23_03020 [Pseudomonadota bacterium]
MTAAYSDQLAAERSIADKTKQRAETLTVTLAPESDKRFSFTQVETRQIKRSGNIVVDNRRSSNFDGRVTDANAQGFTIEVSRRTLNWSPSSDVDTPPRYLFIAANEAALAHSEIGAKRGIAFDKTGTVTSLTNGREFETARTTAFPASARRFLKVPQVLKALGGAARADPIIQRLAARQKQAAETREPDLAGARLQHLFMFPYGKPLGIGQTVKRPAHAPRIRALANIPHTTTLTLKRSKTNVGELIARFKTTYEKDALTRQGIREQAVAVQAEYARRARREPDKLAQHQEWADTYLAKFKETAAFERIDRATITISQATGWPLRLEIVATEISGRSEKSVSIRESVTIEMTAGR